MIGPPPGSGPVPELDPDLDLDLDLGHAPGKEYDGPAVVEAVTEAADGAGDGALEVSVRLRGHVEPIDGRFHWYGRIAADRALDERHRSGATVTLRTAHGQAQGRLSNKDPWGRFRITGTGRPPF